jgi:soluble lytic murein transglycosylase-like protein
VGRRILALLLLACLAGVAAGAVGNARAGKPAIVVAARIPALPATLPVRGPACPIPARYREAFDTAARETGLALALLVAVARVESNLRQEARSEAGALGLLQVMPTTASALELDPAQPGTNVLAGARYLSMLLDRFDSTDLALAAYNAGPTAVAEFGGAPTGQTLTYVANVTALWRALRTCR